MTDVDRAVGELPIEHRVEEVLGNVGPHRSVGSAAAGGPGGEPAPTGPDADQAPTLKVERRCELCCAVLKHKRTDALYCSPSHRAEASRQRRLRDGHPVDGYASLAAYLDRRRRRTDGC